ncbi:MAG: BolA family protein [Ideonella sp.]
MPVSADDLDNALRMPLQVSSLEVRDDSHLHAGHAGAREGRHFSVRVVSERFKGLSRVARHRLVYDAAAALMDSGIHALAIDARTPDES